MIAGLGNPGAEYADTRHNAGFKAVDALGRELRANYWKSRGGALIAECRHEDDEIFLVKPQSFMNLSGGPVKAALSAYGVDLDHLIVIHDELDLEPGTVRVKNGGGSAGHNGIKSIIGKTGSGDFVRVRVGIGHPEGRRPAADYVLDQLKGENLENFEVDCENAATIGLFIITDGVAAAMNRYNVRA